jgi:DNA-binding transcriptional MerR regulator
MEMRKEQFSSGEIAEAIGMDQTQLQNWLRRADLILPTPIAGRRLYSAEFAVRLAWMKRLSAFGMGPRQAGHALHTVGLCPPNDDLAPWVGAPSGKEACKFSFSGYESADDEIRGAGSYGRSFYESGFVNCIQNPQSDPGPEMEEHIQALEQSTSDYLVLHVGAVAKSVLEGLEAILAARQGGGNEV